ncbi:hypothetical protein KZ483_20575 [Paenibacillus sp. sptzw28]|uniref:hypothetical protein n=1 Tax=Paenibacillus sp. sptzw28 TaxID=715179 RepID=UPI001C6E3E7A|nr:hypothetical protein [Paenibacillus sp. sptzw28]QYR20214.1 hypothetical protein KZ483_20575 [Paenibacillus sp. sptzw28]
MKKLRLLIFIMVAFVLLGLIWYFAYPLKIQNVMRHTNQVEKIDFIINSQGEIHHYSMHFNEKTNISEMINLLDSVSYSRELKTYQGSTDRLILMIIFYRNREGALTNYSFDISESGIIISENKQYQMNGDTGKVFNKLYEWIKNRGLYSDF